MFQVDLLGCIVLSGLTWDRITFRYFDKEMASISNGYHCKGTLIGTGRSDLDGISISYDTP